MTVLYLAIGFLSGMVVTGLIFLWDDRLKDRRIKEFFFDQYKIAILREVENGIGAYFNSPGPKSVAGTAKHILDLIVGSHL